MTATTTLRRPRTAARTTAALTLAGALTGAGLVAAVPAHAEAPDLVVTPSKPGGAYFYGQGITLTAAPDADPGAGSYQWWVKRSGGSYQVQPGAATSVLKLPTSPVWDGARAYAAWLDEDGRVVSTSEPVGLQVTTKPARYRIDIAPLGDHHHSGDTVTFALTADPADHSPGVEEHYHWYLRKPGEEFYSYLPDSETATSSPLVVDETHDGATVVARLFDAEHAVVAETPPATIEVDDHGDHGAEQPVRTRTAAALSRQVVDRARGERSVARVTVTAEQGRPSGTVRLWSRGRPASPSYAVSARGLARVLVPRLERGVHPVRARFTPYDDDLRGSVSAAVRLRVR